MPIHTKICGLTTREAVDAAMDGGAAYLGFVFYPKSPRHVTPERAAELSRHVPKYIATVAVVVDATDAELDAIFSKFRPDFIQLHGKESPARAWEIKGKYGAHIIKAATVRTGDDIAGAMAYINAVDMLLFDAKAPEAEGFLPGGNGLRFDWNLLRGREFPLPWILSGGLRVDNVREAVRLTAAKIVDVSSSLESEPGIKDPALVRAFLDETRQLS